MSNSMQQIYEHHHATRRNPGFSVMEKERGRLLEEIVGKGKKVLDIGCRDGALTRHFVEGNEVLGVDIDMNALSKAKTLGIETAFVDLNGDWGELKGRKFDVMVAGEVVEHLYYPDKLFEKVSAHLENGGLFLGSVPNAFGLKHRLRYLRGSKKYTPLSDPTHINHFHIDELQKMLAERFSQVEIRGLGRFQWLSKVMPGWFAFDLFFIAKK